jgi:predicted Ser/Thr protein kinase
MGVVYRATQLRLGRSVALKLVTPAFARDPSFRERFRREWMIAASIDHPNVIPVYEAGEDEGALFIAMRWVEGTNLRELIDAGVLEPRRAVHLVSQVASALDAAHARDLIHRDVKPANVLVTGQDHVYLTDFGLTKHASSISGLTRTGRWVGTVDYTAPEQIEGASVCRQTDVYSLGCLLFEALTGRPPHKRENELATLWAHVYKPPPSVREIDPELPAGFDDVLQRALAKDPADRYQSAGDLGRAAVAVLEAEAPAPQKASARASTGGPPLSDVRHRRGLRRPGRPVMLAAAGLALVLAAAAAAIVISSGSDEAQQDRTTAATSPPLRAASAWRPLPSMPTARQNMPSAVLDGTIWVVGGLEAGSEGSRKLEGFDPVINAWKAGPDLPARLHHEMAVTYKDELVVIGGWIPKGANISGEVSDRVFALRGGKWVELPSLNRPRAAAAAAVVGDRIVVVGGQANDRLVPTTEVFDGKRWSTRADIPTAREHLAAASDGHFVYAVGGRHLSSAKNSHALERYEPDADRWQRLPDMPTARGGLGAAIAGGRLYAIGGETPTDVMGKVESYDLASKAWTSGPSMRTPRHGITAAAIGRSVYALGGATRAGHATAAATAEALGLGG